MQCTNGHDNDDAMHFCGECGLPLGHSTRCANGHNNDAGTHFCGECGLPLDAASLPPPSRPVERVDAEVVETSDFEPATDAAASIPVAPPLGPEPESEVWWKSPWVMAVVAGVVVVAVAGAILSRGGDGTEGDSGRFPIDQATAEAALLIVEDFPSGWTTSPAGSPGAGSVPWAECMGGPRDGLFDLGGVRASSDSFDSGDIASIENTVSIADQETVDEFMDNFGDIECIRRIVETNLPGSFEDISVSRLDVSPTGDKVVANRIVATTREEASGTEIVVEVYADTVVVQIGNAFTALEFYSVLEPVTGSEPFDVEDIDRYVAIAAARLGGRSAAEVEESQELTVPDLAVATSASGNCEDSIAESITAVDVLLDIADSGTAPEQVYEVFREIGVGIGQNCADVGSALSEFIVHTSNERSTRSDMANLVIDSMLPGLCDLEYELSPSAQLVCAAS